MKKCSKCGIEKDECEFFFRNKNKNILHTTCKMCKREIDRNSYSNNSNNRKIKIKERRKVNKDLSKNYIRELKQNSKCSKCGEERWYVLDFHHSNDDDKIENISKLANGGATKKIQEELKKCIILCSNCHRELHHLEREEG
jgi:formate dehydrogenase assembly factor FdhD